MSPSTIQDPERHTFAIQVLKAFALFGVFTCAIEFLGGRYLTSAEDAAISIVASLVLYLAREPRFSKLPLKFSIGMMLCICLVGTFQLLPQYLDNCVWAIIFPFAFFFLAGLRTGLRLSLLCALAIPLSYFIFPLFNDAPRITPYALLEIVLAFLLSIMLAYKYESIRTRQEILLRHSAECDPLTGLYNRRGFATLSEAILRQALRLQQSFAVVLIDIDDFKRVNDTQGHDAGDRLLKEIASLLQQHTRSADIVARWGGEEFILLLAQNSLESARIVAEKIRSAISVHPFTAGAHTSSFGIAVHEQNEPLEETIKRADLAMYKAKQNGKNKVEALVLQPA